MIIDAHMHLGEDLLFNSNDNEEDILQYMEENHIDGCILQTGLINHDVRKANERIYAMSKKYAGKFWGILAVTPIMDEDKYFDYVRWAIGDLGFKGLKLHPNAFCCPPNSPQAQKVFRAAEYFDIPVMIHTGIGVPASLPGLAMGPAQAFPDVKIILAHAGNTLFAGEALLVAQNYSNIYLETSWTSIVDKKMFIDNLGVDRLIFGTDVPLNSSVEMYEYNKLDLEYEQYQKIMGGNAKRVFNL